MRVVLIHGRAASMDVPEIMARDWEAALRFGLRRAGSAIPAGDVDVRFAFYGSVWRPDERQPLPAIDFGPPVPQLGLPGLGDLALWVDQHLGVGAPLVELLLHDLDDYYAEPDLRKLTNDRLVDACTEGLTAGEQVVVVGFSMGTLVAYDALRADPTLPVGALVTCGSPLAMPSIYRRVEATAPRGTRPRTPFPKQLRLWVNAWTRDDPATAGHRDMAARFPAPDPNVQHVQDLETWGRSASPTSPAGAHDAIDYLSSRVVGTAVDAALRVL
jgi:hypothetical protein